MEMNGLAWWYLVLKVQLLIGGVEKNPGPKKGKKSFSTRSSTDKKRKQASRYHLTEEEKAAVCKQETSSRAHRRLNLSEEDKKVNRFQQTTARRNTRATLREEEIAAIRSRETRGRRQNRDTMSEENKIKIRLKQTTAKRGKRDNLHEDEKAATIILAPPLGAPERGQKSLPAPNLYSQHSVCDSMEMNGLAWWYLVLKVQLLIGGVEKNPGPKKGKKSFSTRSSTDKKRKQASRYHLTEEEKAAVCKQETSSRAHRRLNLSEEDKKVNRFQQTTARRNTRATLREEEIAAIRSRETRGRRQNRDTMSEENKIKIRLKQTTAKRGKRDNLHEDEKAAIRSRETTGRTQNRRSLSKEKKIQITSKDTKARRDKRKNSTIEQRAVTRSMETASKKCRRQLLDDEETTAVRSRESRGRRKVREELAKEDKMEIRTKDTTAKRHKRDNLHEQESFAVRSRETSSRKRKRKNLDEEQCGDVRFRETSSRKRRRKNLDEEQCGDVRFRETSSRKRRRKNLDEEQCGDIRSRETSSRKRKRKNLDEEQCGDVRFRETSSRKRRRKNLDEEQCGDIRSRETSSRKRKRKNLDEEQCGDVRFRETSSRKRRRKSLDEEKCGDIRSRETSSRKCRRKNLDEDTKAGVRCRETMGKKQKRLDVKKMGTDIHFVRQRFQQSVKEGPTYDCCSCRRLLYRQSVLCYSVKRYKKTSASLLDCCGGNETSSKKFICKTCDASLKKDKMPCQAEANNLYFDNIPDALQDLCPLEQRLISQRLPFMQIASLPRGGQKGIKGAVVNVPAQIDTIVKTLPRMPTDCGLVPVKLKKKLEYKGHSLYQSIRPQAVLRALQCLKESNPLYKDVHLDKDWLTKCEEEEDEELCTALIEAEQQIFRNISDSDEPEDECAEESKESSDKTSDNSEDSEDKLRGIPYNTCLQPADEIPGNHVFCFAPGEGERPVSLLTDNQCEVLAFPSIFPTGKFGHYDQTRPVSLSCRKYFNQRLLNVDRRCASNVEFLFFAQYFTELKQVLDNINIAVRLCKPSQKTAGTIKNSLQDMIQNNDAYKFLQTVRGSQPYWKRTLHDLCAMVLQLTFQHGS